MFIEEKFNYNDTHAGNWWAGEVNMLKKELVNIFKAFITPKATETDQVVSGINYMVMSNLWYTEIVDGELVMFRRQDLPIPNYIVGLSGDVMILTSNNKDNPDLGFIGKDRIRLKMQKENLVMNQLIANQVYKFVILRDSEGIYFNLINLSIKTDIVVSGNSGYVVTIDPTLIVDNTITVEEAVRGDIILNTAHVYYVGEDGVLTSEYDTKRVRVDNTDKTKIHIVDDNDNIDVNGRYAVLSYSK